MNPKIRDNKNTFYYNDEEYETDRYNQYKLNGFIPVTYETSWKISRACAPSAQSATSKPSA